MATSASGRTMNRSRASPRSVSSSCGGTGNDRGHHARMSGVPMCRLARDQHLQYRAEARAGGVAVAGFFQRPAVRVHRQDDVGDSRRAFLGDEELHLPQPRRAQAGKQPLLAQARSRAATARGEAQSDAPAERVSCIAASPARSRSSPARTSIAGAPSLRFTVDRHLVERDGSKSEPLVELVRRFPRTARPAAPRPRAPARSALEQPRRMAAPRADSAA